MVVTKQDVLEYLGKLVDEQLEAARAGGRELRFEKLETERNNNLLIRVIYVLMTLIMVCCAVVDEVFAVIAVSLVVGLLPLILKTRCRSIKRFIMECAEREPYLDISEIIEKELVHNEQPEKQAAHGWGKGIAGKYIWIALFAVSAAALIPFVIKFIGQGKRALNVFVSSRLHFAGMCFALYGLIISVICFFMKEQADRKKAYGWLGGVMAGQALCLIMWRERYVGTLLHIRYPELTMALMILGLIVWIASVFMACCCAWNGSQRD